MNISPDIKEAVIILMDEMMKRNMHNKLSEFRQGRIAESFIIRIQHIANDTDRVREIAVDVIERELALKHQFKYDLMKLLAISFLVPAISVFAKPDAAKYTLLFSLLFGLVMKYLPDLTMAVLRVDMDEFREQIPPAVGRFIWKAFMIFIGIVTVATVILFVKP